MRVLLTAACPWGPDALTVAEDLANIEEALLGSPLANRFDVRTNAAARQDSLARMVSRFKPHVLHFSGHGTQHNELLLQDAAGNAVPYALADFELLLGIYEEAARPRLVVLSACYSEAQAEHITQYIDAAVGMEDRILDRDALVFSEALYGALARGDTLDQAVKVGRASLTGGASAIPKLHVRAAAGASTMQLIGPGPVSRIPDDFRIDRTSQAECFADMLQQGTPAVLVLTGESAMGKTHLTNVFARSAAPHLAVRFELNKEAVTPRVLLDRLRARLQRAVGTEPGAPASVTPRVGDEGDVSSQPVSDNRARVAAEHQDLALCTSEIVGLAESFTARTGNRVVLILDGFDETEGDLSAWLHDSLLPAVFDSDALLAVVAGKVSPTIDSYFELVRVDELERFRPSDLRVAMDALGLGPSDEDVDWAWSLTDDGLPLIAASVIKTRWASVVRAQH